MKKSRLFSAILIIAGATLLLFSYSETGALTVAPGIDTHTAGSGLVLYTSNVSMQKTSVLNVINVSGNYALVSESDYSLAISGNISEYAVAPANATGSNSWNLTYYGISGKYVFIDYSGHNSKPLLIMSTNAPLSSVAGLLMVLAIIMVIGGALVYPYRGSIEDTAAVAEESGHEQ